MILPPPTGKGLGTGKCPEVLARLFEDLGIEGFLSNFQIFSDSVLESGNIWSEVMDTAVL